MTEDSSTILVTGASRGNDRALVAHSPLQSELFEARVWAVMVVAVTPSRDQPAGVAQTGDLVLIPAQCLGAHPGLMQQ